MIGKKTFERGGYVALMMKNIVRFFEKKRKPKDVKKVIISCIEIFRGINKLKC